MYQLIIILKAINDRITWTTGVYPGYTPPPEPPPGPDPETPFVYVPFTLDD